VYRAVIALADREKVVNDRDLAAIVARLTRTPAPAVYVGAPVLDSFTTPAESGYGHGV
jgi:hypothetical protein